LPEILWEAPTSAQLRERFIQMELEIAHVQTAHRNISDEISRLATQQWHLNERAEQLGKLEGQIETLQKQRGNIGLFSIRERRNFNERIMAAKTEREQTVEALKRDYRIKPDYIPAQWQEIDRQRTQLIVQRDQIPDTRQLQTQQQEMGQQYQSARQNEAADKRSAAKRDEKKDSAKSPKEKQDHGKKSAKNMSLADRMAIARAESQLKRLEEPIKTKGQQKEQGRGRGK